MALQLTPEEYQRWQDHLYYSETHSSWGKGVGSKTPEYVKEKIVHEYQRGNSIRRIRIEQGVDTKIIQKVLKQVGLRS